MHWWVKLSRDCLTSNGSEFQSWGPEIAKARKPNVRSRKRGMMRSPLEADWRFCRPAAELTGRNSSSKYSDAAPTRQCRTRRTIFWTRCAFWLVASVARHGWQPRFCWTLLCSKPSERPNSARTEAGREHTNKIRRDRCSDQLDLWHRHEPACVDIRSKAIDAPCVDDAGENSKLGKVC